MRLPFAQVHHLLAARFHRNRSPAIGDLGVRHSKRLLYYLHLFAPVFCPVVTLRVRQITPVCNFYCNVLRNHPWGDINGLRLLLPHVHQTVDRVPRWRGLGIGCRGHNSWWNGGCDFWPLCDFDIFGYRMVNPPNRRKSKCGKGIGLIPTGTTGEEG